MFVQWWDYLMMTVSEGVTINSNVCCIYLKKHYKVDRCEVRLWRAGTTVFWSITKCMMNSTVLQSSDSYWSINDQAIESQRDWPIFPRSHSCLLADSSTGCLASVWALHNILSHPDDGSRPVVPVGGNTRSFDLFCVQTKSYLVHHKCKWVWYEWCSLSCWLDGM